MNIVLHSVVTSVDDETFITYAMYSDGKLDMSSGTPLEEHTKEWYDGLSEDDMFIVKHLLDIKKYLKK
jgi:hypothetical protein